MENLWNTIELDYLINVYNNPNLRESLDPKVLELVKKIEEKIPMILAIFGSIDLSSNEAFRIWDWTLSQREFVGCMFNAGRDWVIKI